MPDNNENFVHDIIWTDEVINRFWDVEAEVSDGYFSMFATPSLLRIIKSNTQIKGKAIMDYGCGNGYFLTQLIKQCSNDSRLYGCDVSDKSIYVTNNNEHLKNNNIFRGAKLINKDNRIPFEDNTMDVITCFEVIEHMDNRRLNVLFSEIGRVLKKDGLLFISTPNNENLINLSAICPECGCKFHRYQHVRVWTPESLTQMIEPYITMEKIMQMKINPSRFHEFMSDFYYTLKRDRSTAPNLIWIGRKM